ncbi:MAG: DUF4350 domain-containing protein [Pyrinomonadaceae bacterium]
MKQRLAMLLIFALVVAALIALNAASYQQKPTTPDNEGEPNRSSFNSGSTGTAAWYSLLAETGRKVTRWQEAPASLLTAKTAPAVFVVVGAVRREFTDKEAETLLTWVDRGGRLVLIDRDPPEQLAVTTANWKVEIKSAPDLAIYSTDPTNREQMTKDVAAVHPSQPSVFTQGVNAVQFSRFAQRIDLSRFSGDTGKGFGTKMVNGGASPDVDETLPPPRAIHTQAQSVDSTGPVVHVSQNGKNYVAEVPFGSGRIIFVSDPYIVSNAGIALADNAVLATDLVSTRDGTIAFDEFHQGYSKDSNRFLQFFAGTPVVAIFLQGLVLVGLVFYSRSRRFARALPATEPDRLSKLEYVSAMAELQQRTRAWDLAIENIYTDFRRRSARLFGLDVKDATSDELAKRIGERIDVDPAAVRETLYKCEEIILGERTTKKEIVQLADSIREIEQRLNLRRGRATK